MRVYNVEGCTVDLCPACLQDPSVRTSFRIPEDEEPDIIETLKIQVAAANKGDAITCEKCGDLASPIPR